MTANQISNTNWWHALLFTKEFEIYILAEERLKSQQVYFPWSFGCVWIVSGGKFNTMCLLFKGTEFLH